MGWLQWISAFFLGGCVIYMIAFSFVVLSDKLPWKRKKDGATGGEEMPEDKDKRKEKKK